MQVITELSCNITIARVITSVTAVVLGLTLIELIDEFSQYVADWLKIWDAIEVLGGCLSGRSCGWIVVAFLAHALVRAFLPSSEGTDACTS